MKDVYVRKPNDKERRLLEDCPIWEHDPAVWMRCTINAVKRV